MSKVDKKWSTLVGESNLLAIGAYLFKNLGFKNLIKFASENFTLIIVRLKKPNACKRFVKNVQVAKKQIVP